MRWVVGDIHGMLRPLRSLVGHVTAKDPAAQFLFVGDYVNRGPDSRGVIDLLLSLQDEGRAKFVRGNHDDIFDMVLSGQTYAYHPDARSPLAATSGGGHPWRDVGRARPPPPPVRPPPTARLP